MSKHLTAGHLINLLRKALHEAGERHVGNPRVYIHVGDRELVPLLDDESTVVFQHDAELEEHCNIIVIDAED